MSDLTLNEAELARITGYRSAAWQRKWLDQRHWKYTQDRRGRPVVARDYYLKQNGVNMPSGHAGSEPNWGAIERR